MRRGVPVTVIADAADRGLAAAFNQGLKAARGEYLVLLNNDVVVTDSWLDQLIALAGALHPESLANGSAGNSTPASESPVVGSHETIPPTSASPVIGRAEASPPPSASPVIGCARPPPGPPFARGEI